MTEVAVGLAEAIAAVRHELERAQREGSEEKVRFAVGPVELEMTVEFRTADKGGASVNVLNIVSLGGETGVDRGETHRLTVQLQPIGARGESFGVASEQATRPR